jgi:hypothetical protein
VPTSASIYKEFHQNEYAAVENVAVAEITHKYNPGAHICPNLLKHHQNEFAAVKSITDEERWKHNAKIHPGAHLCQYM